MDFRAQFRQRGLASELRSEGFVNRRRAAHLFAPFQPEHLGRRPILIPVRCGLFRAGID
jgi:hypothetical protein